MKCPSPSPGPGAAAAPPPRGPGSVGRQPPGPVYRPLVSLCDRRRGGRAAWGVERGGRRQHGGQGGSGGGLAGVAGGCPRRCPLLSAGPDARRSFPPIPRPGSILWPRPGRGGGREEAGTGARLPRGRVRRGPGRGCRCAGRRGAWPPHSPLG